MTANLATFVDRYTMKHLRIYPHPVDRVWRALTDDREFSTWFGFECTFDMRPGGRCQWGPAAHYFETTIGRLEPKTLIEHLGAGETDIERWGMRFRLTPVDEGTRFEFTQRFDPNADTGYEEDRLGADLPGGPDTPWRPGFVGGFHGAWDNLANFLDGAPLDRGQESTNTYFAQLVDEWLWRKVVEGEFTQDAADRYAAELRGVAYWDEMNEVYRRHIRETIPD
jgi:uncharacterized protein YndB with AHSA1/START domain